MNILHVASFIGNIGDNASHKGFYGLLDQYAKNYSVERLEIRRFYKNYTETDKLSFDESFVNYANRFDFLVIGGGGFLDYWVPGSHTGTTIDIPIDLVSKISVKTIITSVGCIPHKVVPEGNLERFRSFLDAVLDNRQIHLSVRNDGSKQVLRNELGSPYYDAIPEFLDNGFFYRNSSDSSLPIQKPFSVINITSDQLSMQSEYRESVELEQYYSHLVDIVRYLIREKGSHLALVPHIYRDLEAISELMARLPDVDIRNHITVAPCVQGSAGADYIFSLYKSSNFILASRFHANICSLAMNKPVVGLAVLDRVKYMYDGFGLANYVQPGKNLYSKFVDLYLSQAELSDDPFSGKLQSSGIYCDTVEYYKSIFA